MAAILVPMQRLLRPRKKKGGPPKTDVIVNDDVKMVDAPDISNHIAPDLAETFARHLQNVGESQKVYERSKAELLGTESINAWDRFTVANASDAERMANTIIWKIREDERDNLFGNKASESIPGLETRDMGGQFLTNRTRIEEKSKIYGIAQEMPKGCHLHLHFNAEIPPPRLIEKARDMPNMFVRSTQPLLEDEDYAKTEIVFNVMAESTPTVDIFSADYKPEFRAPGATPWMRWSDFRRKFSAKRGGGDAEDWVQRKMVLSEEEVYGITQTTNG